MVRFASLRGIGDAVAGTDAGFDACDASGVCVNAGSVLSQAQLDALSLANINYNTPVSTGSSTTTPAGISIQTLMYAAVIAIGLYVITKR